MAKFDNRTVLRITAAMIVATVAAVLAGCSADIASYALVTTDKYQYYDCDSLADQVRAMTKREKDLEELMAKAGPVVSAVSYQADYVSVRGELRELRRTAAQKHCEAQLEKALTAQQPPGQSEETMGGGADIRRSRRR
jgi:hypothetical protein